MDGLRVWLELAIIVGIKVLSFCLVHRNRLVRAHLHRSLVLEPDLVLLLHRVDLRLLLLHDLRQLDLVLELGRRVLAVRAHSEVRFRLGSSCHRLVMLVELPGVSLADLIRHSQGLAHAGWCVLVHLHL